MTLYFVMNCQACAAGRKQALSPTPSGGQQRGADRRRGTAWQTPPHAGRRSPAKGAAHLSTPPRLGRRRAATRPHEQAHSCTGTACKPQPCRTTTFVFLTRKGQLWPDRGLVHELWPLRRPGQADQLHAPGPLPYLCLLAGFDQALGNEARLVVAGEVRVGRAHDAALGVAQVYPIPGHPMHSG